MFINKEKIEFNAFEKTFSLKIFVLEELHILLCGKLDLSGMLVIAADSHCLLLNGFPYTASS